MLCPCRKTTPLRSWLVSEPRASATGFSIAPNLMVMELALLFRRALLNRSPRGSDFLFTEAADLGLLDVEGDVEGILRERGRDALEFDFRSDFRLTGQW